MNHYMLDEKGEVVMTEDLLVWAAWFERATRDRSRIIAHDRDEQPGAPDVLVSTVFLGLDHNWTGHGLPVLWETLVMGGPHDGHMRRYTSRAEAIAGHQAVCRMVNPVHS
jgi:hypothetical protein